uniref:MCL1 apoptosis regulator, BCL2 family member b n=1 Tax=Cynoglossus semilaevis TaxID=244447 RepID=A0A3P8VKM5_CYNSE
MNIIKNNQAKLNVATGVLGCFIVPQNGVVNGTMHYGTGNSTPIALASSLSTHNDSMSSVTETQRRPKDLQVNTANGHARKSHCEVDEGSEPCTPEPHSEAELDVSQAGDEVLDTDTKELIFQFYRDFTTHSPSKWGERKALTTMKRVVDDVLEKHRYAYNGMINKLSLENRQGDLTFISSVAKSLFGDGTTNWGRITSLVAFGAVVCQHLKECGQENSTELVGREISSYLLSYQRDWLLKNNSWDGFVEFFRVEDPEATMRNTLLGLFGVAGLGATLALLIRWK